MDSNKNGHSSCKMSSKWRVFTFHTICAFYLLTQRFHVLVKVIAGFHLPLSKHCLRHRAKLCLSFPSTRLSVCPSPSVPLPSTCCACCADDEQTQTTAAKPDTVVGDATALPDGATRPGSFGKTWRFWLYRPIQYLGPWGFRTRK